MDPISRRNVLARGSLFLSLPTDIFALDPHPEKVKFKAKTLDGEMFSTESIQGKVVLVQFWATRCPYCVTPLRWMLFSANSRIKVWRFSP